MTRRELLFTALATPAVPLFNESAPAAAQSPLALRAADGELVYVGRNPVRIKVSPTGAGRLAMITQDVSPGLSIPVHLHEKEDEIIFIQSGTGEATLDDKRVELTAGSTLCTAGDLAWRPEHRLGNTSMGRHLLTIRFRRVLPRHWPSLSGCDGAAAVP